MTCDNSLQRKLLFCSLFGFVKYAMERNPRILLVNLCVLFGLLYISDATFTEENYKSKYEYKYSFKGPSLSQPGKGIPFWNHSFGE